MPITSRDLANGAEQHFTSKQKRNNSKRVFFAKGPTQQYIYIHNPRAAGVCLYDRHDYVCHQLADTHAFANMKKVIPTVQTFVRGKHNEY